MRRAINDKEALRDYLKYQMDEKERMQLIMNMDGVNVAAVAAAEGAGLDVEAEGEDKEIRRTRINL